MSDVIDDKTNDNRNQKHKCFLQGIKKTDKKIRGIKTWRSVKIFLMIITLGISRPLKTLITTYNF